MDKFTREEVEEENKPFFWRMVGMKACRR